MSDLSSLPQFQRTQYQFAAHLRNPEHCIAPLATKDRPIEERRLGIYRELVYNNIHNFINSGFPVLCEVLGADSVHQKVRKFISDYRCQTPYFLEISQEFLRFLQEQYQATENDPPFMLELAHYEWVELALDVSEEILPAQVTPEQTREESQDDALAPGLLEARYIVSPLAWSLSYTYPVHRIGQAFQPEQTPEEGTFLVVYRNRQEQVGFLEINAVTARLLQLLGDSAHTGEEALSLIASELAHPEPDQVLEFGRGILGQLHEEEIIFQSRSQNP